MTIPLYGSPGAFFNRMGKLGLLLKQSQSYQSSQKTNMIDPSNGVVAQFNGEPDIQALMGSSYITQLSATEGACQVAKQIAATTVNRMVFRDNPQINQTLTQYNTLTSLKEVIRQCKVNNVSILAMVLSNTPTLFTAINTNIGNGAVNASTKRPFDGLVLENAYGETLTFKCTSDSYTGNQSSGNEQFTVTGNGQETDFFAFDWPLGSNSSTVISAIDGSKNNANGNGLTNSNWATWASGVPSFWTINANNGTINQENGIIFDGPFALKILGDGATLTSLQQQFGSSANGTSGQLSPLTQYSVNVWMRRDGVSASNGTLFFELIDQNGNIINDANGVPNQFSVNLTTLTTVYTPQQGVFRTPTILPTQQFLRIRQGGTPLTSGRAVYLARLSMGFMTQLYTSGPFVAAHSGSTPFVFNDYTSLAIVNSRGAGGTLSTFQTLMAQLFSDQIYANELLFPSSATPVVADSLIG